MTDYLERAASMPCDPDLLDALGRVSWATIRLHSRVRDALHHIADHAGRPRDDAAAFGASLGGVVGTLDREAGWLPSAAAPALRAWCRDQGHPAVRLRNGVAHAVPFTASDGRQALGGFPVGPDRRERYLERDLLEIAGRLVHAAAELPPGPY